jgi:tetratricopeptide (TPR) repeat protein
MTPLAQKEPAMSAPATAADPASLTRRVRQLIETGRPRAARPLLAALRRLVPVSPELDELEGRLSLREGRVSEALAALDAAIARAPGQAPLYLCRADARMQADETVGAALDAAEAVILDPTPQAKAVLGTVLLELGRVDDALTCLEEAMRAAPGRGDFRRGLAAAQERAGDPAAALATLQEGITQSPRDLELRIAAIRTAIHSRAFGSALALATAARDAGLADARVFGLLGHALSSLGRHEEAGDAYLDALRLGPEDAYVRHLVAASGRLPATTRAPADYVRVVFDGYAKRFESHLIELGYRIPGLDTHTQAHLIAAAEAAGLRVRELREEPLRDESDVPVQGLIAVLERPA